MRKGVKYIFAYLQADFTKRGSLAVNGLLDIIGNLRVSGRNGVCHGVSVKVGTGRLWEKCGSGEWVERVRDEGRKKDKWLCIRPFIWLVGGGCCM
jgi:hypothetical protein